MNDTRRRLPFELAFAYAFPLPPVAAGFVWTVLILAATVALQTLGGPELIESQDDGSRRASAYGILVMVSSLMWGMLPATGRATSSSELWDLREETPPLDARARWQREKQLLREEGLRPQRLMIATIAGALAGAFLVRWIFGGSDGPWHAASAWFTAVMLGGLFIMLARGIAMTHEAKRQRAPIFEAAETVDLLDLEPQLRAGRCALRTAVSWMVGASLSSLFFLLGGDQLTIGILIFITVIALVSVLPPILRIQRIIRQSKQTELQRLQAEVRQARAEVLESTQEGPDAAPGRLADLLAYLHYVETLPELPFDKAKLAITSLYFAVPLISWVWISLVQSWLGMIG